MAMMLKVNDSEFVSINQIESVGDHYTDKFYENGKEIDPQPTFLGNGDEEIWKSKKRVKVGTVIKMNSGKEFFSKKSVPAVLKEIEKANDEEAIKRRAINVNGSNNYVSSLTPEQELRWIEKHPSLGPGRP